MPFYVFAWIASFGYGFSVIAGKLTAKYQIKNSWQFSFFYTFLGLVIILPLVFVNGVVRPARWGGIIVGINACRADE